MLDTNLWAIVHFMDDSLSTHDSDINAEARFEQRTDAPALIATTPFDLETVTITRREYVEIKNHAALTKALPILPQKPKW